MQIVFSGRKSPDRPTITITDLGEGQDPERFADTFLSLNAKNKGNIPFVQGKFNMGSTGAVPFCSPEHNYQLILSKRHAKAEGDGAKWGFTIVRRLRPAGLSGLSEFQYLAPGGSVLSVKCDALPIWSNADGSFDDISYGSLIRLYEYDIPEKTNAKLDFSRMLNRRLFRIPIPIVVIERRKFKGNSTDTIVPGLETRLAEDTADAIEDNFPVLDELTVPGVGKVHVTLVPFKEGVSTEHWMRASEAVIFTVNGQAHSFRSREFLRGSGNSRVGLSYLAPSLLVEVDCSGLPNRVTEHLFMGSRDRMRETIERTKLLRALTLYLRQHEGLRGLNAIRRTNAIEKSTKSGSHSQELFNKMVETSSSFSAILRGVGSFPDPTKGNGKNGKAWVGRKLPSYLEWSKGGPFLEKNCPSNSYCQLELITDARNSFLNPGALDPGLCEIEPNDWVTSRKLWNGKLTIRLTPPEGIVEGTEIPIIVRFSHPAKVDDLVANGRLMVTAPHKKGKGGGNKPPNPSKQQTIAAPEIREVRKENWTAHGFDAKSVARVENGEDNTLVFVNMDNRGLRNYCYDEPQRTAELSEMHKLASAALAVAMKGAVDKEEVTVDSAERILEAVGDVLTPTVDFARRFSGSDD